MSNEKVNNEEHDQSMVTLTRFKFIRESNRIEGILREPAIAEIEEFDRFMNLETVRVEDLKQFVSVYQPGAKLRDKPGMDVRVGDHLPTRGGRLVKHRLHEIIAHINEKQVDAYSLHLLYERLHPFTDCNGRSGRMLWAWQQKDLTLGFLHKFYYQALANAGR